MRMRMRWGLRLSRRFFLMIPTSQLPTRRVTITLLYVWYSVYGSSVSSTALVWVSTSAFDFFFFFFLHRIEWSWSWSAMKRKKYREEESDWRASRAKQNPTSNGQRNLPSTKVSQHKKRSTTTTNGYKSSRKVSLGMFYYTLYGEDVWEISWILESQRRVEFGPTFSPHHRIQHSDLISTSQHTRTLHILFSSRTMASDAPPATPTLDPTVMLKDKVISHEGKVESEKLKNRLIALYFSAHWCKWNTRDIHNDSTQADNWHEIRQDYWQPISE